MNEDKSNMEGPKDALGAITSQVGGLDVIKPKELKLLFIVFRKWYDNKSRCNQKQRLAGKAAQQKIILHNLKLVIKIAFEYSRYSSIATEDLINEGTIGLMRAVEKYDINNGARFSTYSSLWIKQTIRRSLSDKSRDIRLPVHVAEKVGKVMDFVNQYKEKHNEPPDVNIIAANVKGISKKILNDLINGGVINLVFLDQEIKGHENEVARYGDVLEDSKIVIPDKAGLIGDDVANLKYYLNKLTRREKAIMTRRFGMTDGHPQTLDTVAEYFGVSRERIRQLQMASLRKLRRWMGRKYGENFFLPKF